MSLRAGVLSFGLVTAALAWPAGATNRLQNPYFAGNLDGWTADPPEDASYDPLVGTSGGSARLRVNPVTEIRQCVSVTPAAVYDFQVSCLADPPWVPFGSSCDLVTQFYAGSACDGEALSIHSTSPDSEASGWRLITYRSPTPLGCHSVMMKLHGDSGSFGGGGTVHFDDALVDPVVRGDLDNDDHTDLILRHSAPSIHFSIWQMSDTTRLQEWDLQPQQQDPFTPLVGVGEFNSDWYSDLVFQNSYTGVITLWRMVGPYLLGAAQTYDTLPPSNQWRVRATGRFKKWSVWLPPKTDDLVLRNLSTNALQVWMTKDDGFGLAGVVIPSPDHAVDSNWTLVAGADFNQDGHGDFLWYNESTGKIVTWYMNEDLVKISGQFTTPDSAGGAGWRVVAAGDYGMGALAIDGTPDIVWRNSMSGKLVVWHMDAASHRTDGVFTTPDAPSQPLAWTVVGPH